MSPAATRIKRSPRKSTSNRRSKKKKKKYSAIEDDFDWSNGNPYRDAYGGQFRNRHCQKRVFRYSKTTLAVIRVNAIIMNKYGCSFQGKLPRSWLGGVDHCARRLSGFLLPWRVLVPLEHPHECHKPCYCPDARASYEPLDGK